MEMWVSMGRLSVYVVVWITSPQAWITPEGIKRILLLPAPHPLRSSGIIFPPKMECHMPRFSWKSQFLVLSGRKMFKKSLGIAPGVTVGNCSRQITVIIHMWPVTQSETMGSVWIDHIQFHGREWTMGRVLGLKVPVLLAMWPETSPFSVMIHSFLICKLRELMDYF